MSPEDERHGTWAGYQLGCRLECCITGARRYQKGRVLDAHRGRPRTVSSIGTRRRIEALACLGWTGYDIAARLGHGREWIRQVYMRDEVHRRTAERIAAVYDELSMLLPPTHTPARRAMVSRTRKRAERNGWFPPLAWDNIDDPNEVPRGTRASKNYKAADLLAEWDHLRRSGESIGQAAARLGVTVDAIEKASERVRRRAVA